MAMRRPRKAPKPTGGKPPVYTGRGRNKTGLGYHGKPNGATKPAKGLGYHGKPPKFVTAGKRKKGTATGMKPPLAKAARGGGGVKRFTGAKPPVKKPTIRRTRRP